MIVLVREGALLLDEVLGFPNEPPNFLSRTTSLFTLFSASVVDVLEIVEMFPSIKFTVFFELVELLVVSFVHIFFLLYSFLILVVIQSFLCFRCLMF